MKTITKKLHLAPRLSKAMAGLIYFSFAATALTAQVNKDSLPGIASLDQLVGYAVVHHPLIRQQQLQEEITSYNIRSKLADWYPQIGGTYSLQHAFQRSTSFFNGAAVPVGATNTSAAQLYLNQAIFNRDVLLANKTKGDVRLQVRQATLAERINITINVSKAFYDVVTTQQQIRVINENIARLQKSYDDAYYRYQAGVNDKTDFKRAQIALNNAKATRQADDAFLKAKVEVLKNAIGYPVEARLTVVYDSARMEREASFDTLQAPDASKRIEYTQLVTQKRLQQANLIYQRNAALPNVSANAAYNLNYFNNSFGKLYNESYPNSYAGLTLGIPIFQGGKRKANIKAAELGVTQIDLALVNLKSQVNSQYAAALGNYKAHLADYLATKENVALAREVYDVIDLQYKAGVKAYLEVILAESDLRTAQINYFNALNQVLAARVDAEQALGLIK